MVTANRMAVFSFAALLALIPLLGCMRSQPDSVTEIDQTQGTEMSRRVEEARRNETDRTIAQTPRTGIDDVDSSEPRFGRSVKLLAAGKPIDIEIGHLVPCVSDWNSDGKKDLIVGQFKSGAIRVYFNRGTDAEPVFEDFSLLQADGKPIRLDAG